MDQENPKKEPKLDYFAASKQALNRKLSLSWEDAIPQALAPAPKKEGDALKSASEATVKPVKIIFEKKPAITFNKIPSKIGFFLPGEASQPVAESKVRNAFSFGIAFDLVGGIVKTEIGADTNQAQSPESEK